MYFIAFIIFYKMGSKSPLYDAYEAKKKNSKLLHGELVKKSVCLKK